MDRLVLRKVLLAILICFVLVCQAAVASVARDDASDFVLLSEAVPDAILEIRYYSTYNFIGDRIDGYEAPVALLTREAAEALRGVSDELVQRGYRLKIFDAYRPQMAVDHFVRWAQDAADVRMKDIFYPETEKSMLFKSGYVASRSGHSRGSTVDLTLFDMSTGENVDMGGPFDFFGTRSRPDYRGITEQQYANRMLLRDVMTRHGFRPISTEWWHFTLNDEPFPDTYFTFPVNADVVPDFDAQADAEDGSIALGKGAAGSRVRYCQELLIRAGYLANGADGSFGAKTEAAVKALQSEHGLEPTGVISKPEMEILSQYDPKGADSSN